LQQQGLASQRRSQVPTYIVLLARIDDVTLPFKMSDDGLDRRSFHLLPNQRVWLPGWFLSRYRRFSLGFSSSKHPDIEIAPTHSAVIWNRLQAHESIAFQFPERPANCRKRNISACRDFAYR